MAETIRDLFVGLGVKTDTEKLDRFDKGIESVKKGMGSALGMAIKLTAGFAALVGVQGFSAAKMADTNLEILRQADALGITNERYQTLMHTFEAFGADANDIADAINTITDRANDAVGGVKSMADDFGLLGIKVQDLKNKKPEQLFDTFVEALGRTEDIAKRNTAVVRILGDDVGRKLLPVLKDGSAGLKKYAEELKMMGVIMSDDAIKKTSAYATQNKRLQLTLTGIRNTIALAIVPSLTKAAKGTTDWILANKPLIDKKISNGMRDVRDVLERVDKMLTRIGGGSREEGIKRVGGALAGLLGGAGILKYGPIALALIGKIVAIGFVPLLVIGLKIAAVVAIIIALGLAIEDVIIFFRGGPSVTGKMIEALKGFIKSLREGNETIDSIIATVEQMGSITVAVFELIWNVIYAIWSRVGPLILTVLQEIGTTAIAIFGTIGSAIMFLVQNITIPLFELVVAIFKRVVGVLLDELNILLANWDVIFGRIGTIFDNVFGDLIKSVKHTFGVMRAFGGEAVDYIAGKLKPLIELAGKALRLLKQGVENAPAPERGFVARGAARAASNFADNVDYGAAAYQGAARNVLAKAGGMGNANFNSTYNVNAAPGMDERKLARNVSDLTRQDQQNAARQMRTRASKER